MRYNGTMTKKDIYQRSLEAHQDARGKLSIQSLMSVKNRDELSIAYTPGVAEPCRVIAQDKARSFDLTWRGRTVAVVSDGTAVLGLGNIGPEAALPVMEGKAVLLKEFGGVDAVPLVINAKNPDEIVDFVRAIAPSFAGINLEDIAAPACFLIEDALQDIGIPVFHDDQHGTAIVVAAALRNAAKVVGKEYADLKVVVVGAGAAGLAVTQMLLGVTRSAGAFTPVEGVPRVADVIVADSKGIISRARNDLNDYKKMMVEVTNSAGREGDVMTAIQGADVVIGVSGPGSITAEMVRSMAHGAIVMAMANPTPEIMPDEAKAAGAAVVATGRSDFPNQVNNVLAFPGIFQAVIKGRLTSITPQMKAAAVEALAELVPDPTAEHILPDPFEGKIAESIATAVLAAAKK